jgi:hypothetical protein
MLGSVNCYSPMLLSTHSFFHLFLAYLALLAWSLSMDMALVACLNLGLASLVACLRGLKHYSPMLSKTHSFIHHFTILSAWSPSMDAALVACLNLAVASSRVDLDDREALFKWQVMKCDHSCIFVCSCVHTFLFECRHNLAVDLDDREALFKWQLCNANILLCVCLYC